MSFWHLKYFSIFSNIETGTEKCSVVVHPLIVPVYVNVVTALDFSATRLKYDKNLKTQLHSPIHVKHKRPFSLLNYREPFNRLTQFSCWFFFRFCRSLFPSQLQFCCVMCVMCVILLFSSFFSVHLISNDHTTWAKNRWLPYFWTVWIMQKKAQNRIKQMRSSNMQTQHPYTARPDIYRADSSITQNTFFSLLSSICFNLICV